MSRYLEMLSLFGVAGAHPGGLAFSKAILQKAALSPNQPILDAGCGTGQTAAYLGHLLYPVTVVDKDPIMLQKAKNRFTNEGLAIPAYQAELEHLPFSSESFSCVLSESVLSFSDLTSSLQEIARVLTPGGMLIGIEAALKKPMPPAEKKQMMDFYGFTCLHEEAEWHKTLKSCGFQRTEAITLLPDDMEFEPTTEMDLSQSIAPIYYDTLQTHYELMQIYSEYLGHCIFIAHK
ncbi:class I SAM-dependent methyltransferase [Bacillus mexicanus]|uniref:class I SAM-dependent methyltransferase n=1 Tax=Bacillus mexicanus TaxID=2834415 RepID=UPI003D1F4159